ncbi:hypothetical protein [Nocardia sp. BMG51109]|uniref:hypothetical protein n=1 Tax=Nocardia sp. BMG51109 TaxID=1056816 RepID=UPI000465A2EC|nr:hypothetical protein [Nocardia sp. BMG51109]
MIRTTEYPGLFAVVALGAVFVVALVCFCRVLREDDAPHESTTLGVYDLLFRLDHTDPAPIRSSDEAHDVTQRHINCDSADCPRKRAALTYLEARGKFKRDSSRY